MSKPTQSQGLKPEVGLFELREISPTSGSSPFYSSPVITRIEALARAQAIASSITQIQQPPIRHDIKKIVYKKKMAC